MGRRRESKVDKSPFKLRRRKLADGRESLFIDHAVNGKHEYKFLKLYLLPETSEKARRENARTIRKAEEIIIEKTNAFIRQKSGTSENRDRSTVLLRDFIDILIAHHKERGKNTYKEFVSVRKNLECFRPGARLCDVDKNFCIDFRDWLLSHCSERTGKPLAKRTAFGYFWLLGNILANAFRMEYIRNNPWMLLESTDKMTEPPATRGFLTLEEVAMLESTPYKRENIRNAFLFCCFSGLRISDLLNLRWNNISDCGDKLSVSFVMRKTSKPVSIPLPSKASGYPLF